GNVQPKDYRANRNVKRRCSHNYYARLSKMSSASTPRPPSGFRHAFRSLRGRDFRYYWFSAVGMTGAQGITQLALAWLVLDLTGSLGQMGVVIFMQGIAWTFVALVGGVLADRYSRRDLLVGAQLFTILSLVVLA